MNKLITLTPKSPLSVSNLDIAQEEKRQAYMDASTDFNLKAGPLYYATHQLWLDTLDFLKESKFYKHQVKKYAGMVERAWKTYEDYLPKLFLDNYALYIDFCGQCYNRRLETDVMNLFHSVKRVLDHNFIPDSEIKAYLISSRELACHCAHFFELYWQATSRFYHYEDLSEPFRYADLTPVANHLITLCAMVCINDKQEVLLDKDNDCVLALNIIDNRIYDIKWVDDCGIDAMRLNTKYKPELQEVIEEYERKTVQETRATSRTR